MCGRIVAAIEVNHPRLATHLRTFLAFCTSSTPNAAQHRTTPAAATTEHQPVPLIVSHMIIVGPP
jgi:hypothetical protein